MIKKIDLRFLAGLLAGAVFVSLVVVLAVGRDNGPGDDASAGRGVRSGGPSGSGGEQSPRDADGGSDDADGGGDDGGGDGDGATSGPAPKTAVPDGEGKVNCPAPTKEVANADELADALAAARPGDTIRMRPGTYEGRFVARTSGAADQPITLCGDPQSIIDGGGVKKGYALHLNRANHWRLIGFTVRNSQKGVMADTVTGAVIQGLTVHDIGDEAVHLRNFSSGNTVQYNLIYNTGLRREKFGEGVYLGTAESNWEQFSGGKMDRSDRNTVRGNVIRATAEAIDIKEGTSGGRITGNIFDGSALGGSKHNDSWVDVKGNGYLIEGNRGSRTLADGFQTHEIVDGWGTGNTFRRNTIDLGGSGGVGIKDTVGGNTIGCDNKVTGGPVDNRGTCS